MADTHEAMLRDLGMDVPLHRRMMQAVEESFRTQVLSQPYRPAGMAYFDEAMRESHGRRVQEIIDHRQAGGKFVGTFCIYVPDEIAIALGALPLALCGGIAASIPYAERVFPRDICPLVRSTFGMAFSGT